MTAPARLDALPTIDLDTLNTAAALQTRVDRKYILPADDLRVVLRQLPPETRVLEVGGERMLRYRSCYFDTPDLDSFHGAVHARRRRFKVRARTYVDSGDSFLEVKTRGGRSATVKDRVAVTDGGLGEIGVRYAAELLRDAGIPDASRLAQRLEPVLETRYRRVTLLLCDDRDEASRATIDVDLHWRDLGRASFDLPDTVIVETKSGSRPGGLDRALWRCGHRPANLSKYGTGLAALRPALPRNKWHRVLTRHFADASFCTPLLVAPPLAAASAPSIDPTRKDLT